MYKSHFAITKWSKDKNRWFSEEDIQTIHSYQEKYKWKKPEVLSYSQAGKDEWMDRQMDRRKEKGQMLAH